MRIKEREERDLEEECVCLLRIEGYISNLKIYVDSSTRLWRVDLCVLKVKLVWFFVLVF